MPRRKRRQAVAGMLQRACAREPIATPALCRGKWRQGRSGERGVDLLRHRIGRFRQCDLRAAFEDDDTATARALLRLEKG
jgi:hypothetical protein